MSVPMSMRLSLVLSMVGVLVVCTNHVDAVIIVQQAKLVALDGGAEDFFGSSVAIDGDTVIVGSPYDDDLGDRSGSAYIFHRTGSVWTQQGKLTALDGTAADRFGFSVSISGDTAVVGSPYADHPVPGLTFAGAAYVFHRSGGIWTQQAKLIASDLPPPNYSAETFGTSVAIDGNRVIVGSPLNQAASSMAGAAYIFERSGNDNWAEQTQLFASDGVPGLQFGTTVAISGGAAIVGADPFSPATGADGAAYVFQGSGSGWTEQAKLTPSGGGYPDAFGKSVAISGVNAIGGALVLGDVNGSGSAFIFHRNGSWAQQARLTASDAQEFDWLGQSVGISGDMAVVGAFRDDHPGRIDAGSAYLYQYIDGHWAEIVPKLTAADRGFDDEFGISVGISANSIVVGAHQDNPRGSDSGSAYVFSIVPTLAALPGNLMGLKPSGGTDTTILSIQTNPFTASSVVGGAGFPSLSGLDVQPGTDVLFASSGYGDGGRLFTIDSQTGVATLVGAIGFDAVPGLAFGTDGTLYGSAAGTDNGDTLITIDPGSGAGTVVGSFGTRYLDSLAVDPTTDILYGAGGDTPYGLFIINKVTATATALGTLTEVGTGDELPGFMAGLAFDSVGNLFGSLGGGDGQIVSIHLNGLGAPTFTIMGDAASGSVSDIAFIPEPATLTLLVLGGLAVMRRGGQWRARGTKCQ